ncbi:MAG: carbon-nitrogen hydrolase family protein [Zoogloeaceae bacterium]|nr:carbon-nitrogen hydrolase family protein [Zoogloeaceae bacterium]
MDGNLECREQAPRNLRIAGIQMVSGPDVPENLAAASRLLDAAVHAGAGAVLFPEFFPVFGTGRVPRALWEPLGRGPIQDWLREQASARGIWIFSGSLPIAAPDAPRPCNTLLAIDPHGNCVARYDKIHLFAFAQGKERHDEADFIHAGERPVALETPFGRVGFSICYDIRFPELYRQLGRLDLILLPAAFTEPTGRAHWQILLRARAIENQCYLLAAAQGGRHANDRLTHGHSMVIDPWGEILDCKGKGEGIVLAELDHARIAQVRRELPALEHRRLVDGSLVDGNAPAAAPAFTRT